MDEGIVSTIISRNKVPPLTVDLVLERTEATKVRVQPKLIYGCDAATANRVCCFKLHQFEPHGYAFEEPRTWLQEVSVRDMQKGVK